jgi:hypothetical protein
MEKVKVVKSGAKVTVYVAIGAAVEAFVTTQFPSVQIIPGLAAGGITVAVSGFLAALANFVKHYK